MEHPGGPGVLGGDLAPGALLMGAKPARAEAAGWAERSQSGEEGGVPARPVPQPPLGAL